ncbi:salicylate hydroxylase [Rhizodiscina lignyota]|uniref:Salicylate hydroxylase n=1 Tax=Rhizodiscina lignyota TaxID=1504668 RepID=A0A9P4M9L0_9PEZI|nr:salicylate hydroxylase [Rhizodiscina lignyota]
MSSHVQVAIIGAGFAGTVLALSLKKHNVTSSVYESRLDGNTQGGNIALAPNALRVLDHVGVYDDVRAAGFVYEELGLNSNTGTNLGEFLNGSEKLYNYPAIRVRRSDARRSLLRKLKEEAIPVHYGKKMMKITEESKDNVAVVFEDRTQVTTSIVIGCDGVHSKVREYIYPDVSPHHNGIVGIQGTAFGEDLQDQHWPKALPRIVLGPEEVFGIVPANPAGTEIGFISTMKAPIGSPAYEIAMKPDKADFAALLRRKFCSTIWPVPVQVLADRVQPQTLLTFPFNIMPDIPKWFSPSGRVIFIGDAAHAMPPTGGQGAAMAFEDAETLSHVIRYINRAAKMYDALMRKSPKTMAELLDLWCNHRKERVSRVQNFTSRSGKVMTSPPGYLQRVVKEWYVWAGLNWTGRTLGAEWIYQYQCEDMNGLLSL